LRELGFEADGTGATGSEGREKFQFVFSNHPIFHPFLSPDYGNLMDIKVSQYVRLKSSSALPLIFSDHGAALFFQATRPSDKLFVAAFGMDREHTTWPIDQTFIPFLDLTLQAARAEDMTPSSFEPGEIGTLQLPAASKAHEVVLRDQERELGRAPVEHGKAQVRMPARPGLYTLTSENREQVLRVLSVNPSPKESQLVYTAAPEALRAWHQTEPASRGKPVSYPAASRVRLAGILQQRLWWWMLLGGFCVLMLETAWVESRKEGR
jgi:hypothetical protein